MRVLSVSTFIVAVVSGVQGFQQQLPTNSAAVAPRADTTSLYGYVPSGFTPEQYKKFKAEEAKKKATAKNLGRLGPKGFQSRSFQSFQEALERGEATHLMPVFNAQEKIKAGKIRREDVPVRI